MRTFFVVSMDMSAVTERMDGDKYPSCVPSDTQARSGCKNDDLAARDRGVD